jgi:DNA-binding transcriptional LysR family regulator
MNVHHLELFYYVAKHGGISAAVRHIPYGIQQPAVSGQMSALEDDLGVRLFERSPFRLTAAGRRLFAHIEPFFAGLEDVAGRLRDDDRPELRLGASELVLRLHVPTVTQRLRAKHPRLHLTLRSGYQTQFETWLRDGLIDLAVVPIERTAGVRPGRLRLLRVPLVLLVPRRSAVRSAGEILSRKKVKEPLVGLPMVTSVARSFHRDLRRLGVSWAQTVEATSMEMITSYVANGEGLGVNLGVTDAFEHPEVRALPLVEFTPVDIGLKWNGEPSVLLRDAILELQRYAHQTWPKWAINDPLPSARRAGRPA